MKPLTVLHKVIGINASWNAAVVDPDADNGMYVQDCVGITPTDGGLLTLDPGCMLVKGLSGTVTAVFGGNGLLFAQVGSVLYRIDFDIVTAITGLTVTGVASGVVTLVDTKVTVGSVVYSIPHGLSVATVCVCTPPKPQTSKVYSSVPPFTKAFMHGGSLAVVAGAFLQFSAVNNWNCFDLKDTFIWGGSTILNATNTPSCIVAVTDTKVIVLVGKNKKDFVYSEYDIKCHAGSLAAGYHSKVGHIHTFLSDVGVFVVDDTGKLTNVAYDKVKSETFDYVYTSAVVTEKGYFAYHSSGGFHYSYDTAGYYKLSADNITLAYKQYRVVDNLLCTAASRQEGYGSVTLIPNDFGTSHMKRVSCVLLSGTFVGTVTVSVQSSDGCVHSESAALTGTVENFRLQGFATLLSKAVNMTITFEGSYFLLRSVQAVITTTARY